MAKPIVLVIHGMGTHHINPNLSSEDIAKNIQEDKPEENYVVIDANGRSNVITNTQNEIIKGIKETAKHFKFEDYQFDQKVDLREFNYSKDLDDIRLKDAEKAQALIDHLPVLKGLGLGSEIVAKILEKLADSDQDKMFFTHWMDVVYYGLMYWGEKIRVDLAVMLNNLLIEQRDTGADIHIIAHSLGTAVLHDTLAKLYRKDADIMSHVPQLDLDGFKFDSITMVANVSRLLNLLNGIADPHHSVVNSGPNGCTLRFYNFYNEFDPFTWFKRWDTSIPTGKKHRETTIRNPNTHDLTEYSAAPYITYCWMANIAHETINSDDYKISIDKHKETSLDKPYDDIKEAYQILMNKPEPLDAFKAIMAIFEASNDAYDLAKSMLEDF